MTTGPHSFSEELSHMKLPLSADSLKWFGSRFKAILIVDKMIHKAQWNIQWWVKDELVVYI